MEKARLLCCRIRNNKNTKKLKVILYNPEQKVVENNKNDDLLKSCINIKRLQFILLNRNKKN